MGYTQYDRSMTPAEALAECNSLCTWNNPGSRSRVLASGITGSGEGRGFYAAVETISDKGRKVWCAVLRIDLSPFGYKDMSEDMGPRIDNAPLHVLQALEPLPDPEPNPPACRTCNGTGILSGEVWAEHAQGAPCHACDGTGFERDRHAYARQWRQRAWARHGGQPQGRQLELI